MIDGREKCAKDAVQRIVTDICQRRGFRQAWEEVDHATAKEIRAEWQALILSAFPPTGDRSE